MDIGELIKLQQYLPLAVLKLLLLMLQYKAMVATVLTACGIETLHDLFRLRRRPSPVATVLTACGIET